MNDDFDFDYQPPVQTETVPTQPTQVQTQPTQTAYVPVIKQQQDVSSSQNEIPKEIPNLRAGKLAVIPINSNYWKPKFGDEKFGLVRRFEIRNYEKKDKRTDEVTIETLNTLIFAEQLEDLSWIIIENSARKLVSALEAEVKAGKVIPDRTGIYIRYTGRIENSTNDNSCDTFEIRIIEI